jgi:hypothetical protein
MNLSLSLIDITGVVLTLARLVVHLPSYYWSQIRLSVASRIIEVLFSFPSIEQATRLTIVVSVGERISIMKRIENFCLPT